MTQAYAYDCPIKNLQQLQPYLQWQPDQSMLVLCLVAVYLLFVLILHDHACLTDTDYPDFWDPHQVEECDLELVLLDPDTDCEEYSRVADTFLQTMTNVSHLEIKRIQNRVVWAKYRDCCRRMLEFNGILREKMLFHGSRGTDPKEIYAGDASFDMRFSGNGMWGKGNYFAVNASYSNGFAYHARGGYKKMLVAWVLTGYSYSSEPHQFDKPPIRTALVESSNDEIQRRYDSITGITGGSKVYVTYENDRAYPAYLVTYFQKCKLMVLQYNYVVDNI